MKYIIYGAGAIGGTIGARLHMSGRPVTLIARGAHLEKIRTRGLEFSEPDRTTTLRMPAVQDPRDIDIDPDDVVILAMKSQDTADAIATLATAAPPDIQVVCAQNGVNNERVALRHFSKVVAALVVVAADHLEPGVVLRFGVPFVGILDVGRYPRGVDESLERVAGELRDAGFRSDPDPRVMEAKYRKLHFNLANVLAALIGVNEAVDDDITARARAEADQVFEAAGISMRSIEEDRRRREGLRTAESHSGTRSGGSSWQSLARGTGTIETDYLNGEIVLLGRLHGIPTPVNEVLCELARDTARTRVTPGSLDRALVEARIEARIGSL
jgi:2-dehydropantoate 2-reductase